MDRYIRVPLSDEDASSLRAGDYVYLTGTLYTARDAAHKRIYEAIEKGEQLPIDVKNNIVYYMGPSPARPGKVIGSAGPTQEVKDAVVRNGAVYFAAVGGAGALLSRSITSSEVIAYEDLGTEAVRKLEVADFPVIVVMDSQGNNLYETAINKYCKNDSR